MDDIAIKIDEIYVPSGRRGDLDMDTVNSLAESILEEGLQTPISVRRDGQRYVLVTGLHRLEACKALGEASITAILVGTPKH